MAHIITDYSTYSVVYVHRVSTQRNKCLSWAIVTTANPSDDYDTHKIHIVLEKKGEKNMDT